MAQITFKKFSQFVDLEGEPTDEQITEIFGIFRNNDKVDALKKRRAELTDKDKALAKKKDNLLAKRAAELRNNGGFDPKEKGTGTMRSAQAMGRHAERDWVAGLTAEGMDPEYDYKSGNAFGRDVKAGKHAKLTADEMKKYSEHFLRGYKEGAQL